MKGERGNLISGSLTKGRRGSDGEPGMKGTKGAPGDLGEDGPVGDRGFPVSDLQKYRI